MKSRLVLCLVFLFVFVIVGFLALTVVALIGGNIGITELVLLIIVSALAAGGVTWTVGNRHHK